MLTEKLRSLLRFGSISTRYKDIYDTWYLCKLADTKKLMDCIHKLIFTDSKMRERSVEEIFERVKDIFSDNDYIRKPVNSGKNWTDVDVSVVTNDILSYLHSLQQKI